jgi:hypothetical protein
MMIKLGVKQSLFRKDTGNQASKGTFAEGTSASWPGNINREDGLRRRKFNASKKGKP